MRFTPYMTVLAALAAIASALPAVDIRNNPSSGLTDFVGGNGTAPGAQEANSFVSPLAPRKDCVKLSKAKKLRKRTKGLDGFDDNAVKENNNIWYVRGDSFLAAAEVKTGQKVKVYNLSGCSAIFVIGADGKPITFHITAGKEVSLAKSAARYIQAQEKSHMLVPKTILVYTHEGGTTNYNDINKALGADLAKLVTHKKYSYNPATAPRTERWQLVLAVGTANVEAQKYDATACYTGD